MENVPCPPRALVSGERSFSDPASPDLSPWTASLLQPQTELAGMKAVFGKWPGDETDDEVLRTLAEIE